MVEKDIFQAVLRLQIEIQNSQALNANFIVCRHDFKILYNLPKGIIPYKIEWKTQV